MLFRSDSLAKKGFVESKVSEIDKRKQQIYLTEKTYKMADRYKIKEQEFILCMFRGVTEEEVENTYKIISKIENNLTHMEGIQNGE